MMEELASIAKFVGCFLLLSSCASGGPTGFSDVDLTITSQGPLLVRGYAYQTPRPSHVARAAVGFLGVIKYQGDCLYLEAQEKRVLLVWDRRVIWDGARRAVLDQNGSVVVADGMIIDGVNVVGGGGSLTRAHVFQVADKKATEVLNRCLRGEDEIAEFGVD